MLQRLPRAFTQVKAGNTSENLLNKKESNNIFSVLRKKNYLKSM